MRTEHNLPAVLYKSSFSVLVEFLVHFNETTFKFKSIFQKKARKNTQ